MIKIPQVFFWKFYSRAKLTCTKTFCFVISTKECICDTQFHGLVTPIVHYSTLSLKNLKLREQLFSGKKAVPLMKVLLILKNRSGKSDEFEKLVGEKSLILQKWLNFSPTKIFVDFFSPDKVTDSMHFSFHKIHLCLLFFHLSNLYKGYIPLFKNNIVLFCSLRKDGDTYMKEKIRPEFEKSTYQLLYCLSLCKTVNCWQYSRPSQIWMT